MIFSFEPLRTTYIIQLFTHIPFSGKRLCVGIFLFMKFIVWLLRICWFSASSISAPSLFFGCLIFVLYALLIFCFGFSSRSFILSTLFCEMPSAQIFSFVFNIYVSLEDLRVHWYHLFVSIRYHKFLHFAICNVVQSKQNALVQNTEIHRQSTYVSWQTGSTFVIVSLKAGRFDRLFFAYGSR